MTNITAASAVAAAEAARNGHINDPVSVSVRKKCPAPRIPVHLECGFIDS